MGGEKGFEMELRFYNSMTRRVEPFETLAPGKVGMYTCGPTVYNFAHIGNFRAYLFEDFLRRTLEFAGYEVRQVMNLTDVDDKTIRGSQQAGKALKDYTAPYIAAFFEDLKALNVEPAAVYPAATDHIPEMEALIQGCSTRGSPTRARTGRSTSAWTSSRATASWRTWTARPCAVACASTPMSTTRRAWVTSLECSAMSMKYLGESFDLHTGGIDNLFPHHENEIAQAEAVTGKPFVRTWMHCAHLRVNGQKMSKSLGNFFTLRDLQAQGWAGREIRYVLLNAQYRQPLNFTFEALAAARTALARVDECVDALTARAAQPGEDTGVRVESQLGAFGAALADDLNAPEAFAALFAFVRAANAALNAGLPPAGAAAALEELKRMDRVLGFVAFGRAAKEEVPAEIQALADARAKARAEKNWAESDRLRDALAAKGWQVRDGKDGQTLKPLAK